MANPELREERHDLRHGQGARRRVLQCQAVRRVQAAGRKQAHAVAVVAQRDAVERGGEAGAARRCARLRGPVRVLVAHGRRAECRHGVKVLARARADDARRHDADELRELHEHRARAASGARDEDARVRRAQARGACYAVDHLKGRYARQRQRGRDLWPLAHKGRERRVLHLDAQARRQRQVLGRAAVAQREHDVADGEGVRRVRADGRDERAARAARDGGVARRARARGVVGVGEHEQVRVRRVRRQHAQQHLARLGRRQWRLAQLQRVGPVEHGRLPAAVRRRQRGGRGHYAVEPAGH